MPQAVFGSFIHRIWGPRKTHSHAPVRKASLGESTKLLPNFAVRRLVIEKALVRLRTARQPLIESIPISTAHSKTSAINQAKLQVAIGKFSQVANAGNLHDC